MSGQRQVVINAGKKHENKIPSYSVFACGEFESTLCACEYVWRASITLQFAPQCSPCIELKQPLLAKRIVHMCASPNRCSESHVSRCHQHRRKSFFIARGMCGVDMVYIYS